MKLSYGFGLWVWIGPHFDQFQVILEIFANSSTFLRESAKKEFLQHPDSNARTTPNDRVTSRPKSIIIQIKA